MRLVAVLGMLAGCQVLFPLEGEPPPPAGCEIGEDEDEDGVDDGCDSCPDMVNARHDEDNDAIDDACDNCPGVANPEQENLSEMQAPGGTPDSVGDA